MKGAKKGGSIKVRAYAKRLLGGQGKTKKEIALAAGYSPNVARSVVSHIESTEGFKSAMADLAEESGNMVMKIYHAISDKDLTKETVPVLLDAVRVLASAWDTFTPKTQEGNPNPLRGILLQHVERQTIQAPKEPKK